MKLVKWIFSKVEIEKERNAESNLFNNEMKDILKTISENQLVIIQELKKMNARFLENMENNKIKSVENKVTGIVEEEFDTI